MNRKQQLLHDIEEYRNLLNQKAKTSSLISEDVIRYSHKLDSLLNEYAFLNNRSHSSRKQNTTI